MSDTRNNKTFYVLSLLITAAGSITFAILWLNNLCSAWRYHVRLFSGVEQNATAVPPGFISALNWSTVDVSTITTFIPFFGFLLLFVAARNVRSRKLQLFFPGYDRLNIALGLLGTLWGIILIGYYPVDQVTIPNLMSCLHTAMFSTLAAILWVMVLEPLVFRPWMTSLHRAGADPETADAEEPVDALLNELVSSLASAGETLKESGAAAKTFRDELEKLNRELAEGRKTESLWREQTMACLQSLAAVAADFKAHQEQLSLENQRLRTQNEHQGKDLAAALDEAARLKRQLDAVRDALK